jgi:DNA-binding Xre family transcriptional regulator
MAVRENVIYQIKKKGWSIVTTSQRSGLPEITIKSIIYGKSNSQRLSTLEKLAKAFDCSVNELIDNKVHQEDEKNNAKNFDKKLFNKASNDVAKYLSDKGINFDKQKTVKLIDALYSLMIKNKNKKITTAIDEGMIEWIIDNIS